MLNQKTASIQTNSSQKMDKEFENLKEIIMKVYDILDEYDRLMKAAEIEMKKIGGESIDGR